MGLVTKRFGAAGASGGKGRGQITEMQAGLEVCAAQELMQETGVEAVAGADWVNNLHGKRWYLEPAAVLLGEDSLHSAFDDDRRHQA